MTRDDPRRRDAGPGARAPGRRRRRRHERVGAVVDVEQRRLAGLEQDVRPGIQRLFEHERGVGDHRAQPLGVPEQLLDDPIGLCRTGVVDLDEHLVLQRQGRLDLLPQDALVEEVLHPDADPVHLVGVGRPDAAARGADPAGAEEALGDLVEGAVVRRDDVGVGRHDEPRGVDAAGLEPVDLLEEHLEVDDDAVADDRRHRRREDAGRQQVQRVLLAGAVLALDDDGVAGVVAPVELDDVVDVAAHEVGRLALALVAPLGSDQHDRRHRRSFSHVRRAKVPRRAEGPSRVRAGASYTPPYRGMPCALGSAQRRRRARAQPSWKRVSTPLTAIRCATRRRTVRRLTPR